MEVKPMTNSLDTSGEENPYKMIAKRYCRDCKFWYNKFEMGVRYVYPRTCKKVLSLDYDSPIEPEKNYASPTVHNAHNDCEYFEQIDK